MAPSATFSVPFGGNQMLTIDAVPKALIIATLPAAIPLYAECLNHFGCT
jgi:hypothetical protein